MLNNKDIKINDKICGYYLDGEQRAIVVDKSPHLLVVAGAGSGKTLTILGKINYLIKYEKIPKDEILCISFTKASSLSLKQKIKEEFKLDMDVFTFHKLSLEILGKTNYLITSNDTLDNIIHKFIYIDVLNNDKFMSYILKYFKERYKNKKEYLKFLNDNKDKINMLEKLINTFIHLLKCNNYNLSSFNLFLKEARKNIFKFNHEKTFLIIVLNIYLLYQKYLEENNEIDFDDMILKAIEKLETEKVNLKYKYIIIDEYQDTSYVRFLLIKKIIDITKSSLMVVGDDFQSIYRFTGCDLSLFLNFKNYFGNSKIMKIQNTYRNSKELIEVAGSFVMKNKKQITKNLKSNKSIDYPIDIVYYKNIRTAFLKLILQIYKKDKKEILVLGRNNFDVNMIIDNKNFKLKDDYIIYKDNKDIKIKYLTVHKSKGLEEENVIMINLENKYLGFPNKIVDSKLLRFVSLNNEKYPYSEERRLFYVALTRTKNKVYLLAPINNESIFVKELKKDYKNKIKVINMNV